MNNNNNNNNNNSNNTNMENESNKIRVVYIHAGSPDSSKQKNLKSDKYHRNLFRKKLGLKFQYVLLSLPLFLSFYDIRI